MFNLDEIDVDFNDELFDGLHPSLNNQSGNKGSLSYGMSSEVNNFNEAVPSKRRCSNEELSYFANYDDVANYNRNSLNLLNNNEKKCNMQNINTFKFIDDDLLVSNFSPSYSPITSTQKEINPKSNNDFNNNDNKPGCLFDRSNIISPIKMKPGICSELRKPVELGFCPMVLQNSKRPRKFPGPAGHLPQVPMDTAINHLNVPSIIDNRRADKNSNQFNSIDQNFNRFPISITQNNESSAWKRARRMIGEECWKEFQKYDLKTVLRLIAEPNGLLNSKIPIICLSIMEIEYLPLDAAAVLCDRTGSIKCAVHRAVLEHYGEKIKSGSVFILKRVSVFSPSGKKFYLNITQSNIIDIITVPDEDEDCDENRSRNSFMCSGPIISKIDIERIIAKCSEIPKIVFDPQSINIEFKTPQYPSAIKQIEEIRKEPPKLSKDKEIDFFDDDMDELLVSFMEDSFNE